MKIQPVIHPEDGLNSGNITSRYSNEQKNQSLAFLKLPSIPQNPRASLALPSNPTI